MYRGASSRPSSWYWPLLGGGVSRNSYKYPETSIALKPLQGNITNTHHQAPLLILPSLTVRPGCCACRAFRSYDTLFEMYFNNIRLVLNEIISSTTTQVSSLRLKKRHRWGALVHPVEKGLTSLILFTETVPPVLVITADSTPLN